MRGYKLFETLRSVYIYRKKNLYISRDVFIWHSSRILNNFQVRHRGIKLFSTFVFIQTDDSLETLKMLKSFSLFLSFYYNGGYLNCSDVL